MVPTRPMPERFRAVTLWFGDPQVTPIQLQTEVAEDQLVAKSFSGSKVTWDFNARRANLSVVMLGDSTDKEVKKL